MLVRLTLVAAQPGTQRCVQVRDVTAAGAVVQGLPHIPSVPVCPRHLLQEAGEVVGLCLMPSPLEQSPRPVSPGPPIVKNSVASEVSQNRGSKEDGRRRTRVGLNGADWGQHTVRK